MNHTVVKDWVKQNEEKYCIHEFNLNIIDDIYIILKAGNPEILMKYKMQ